MSNPDLQARDELVAVVRDWLDHQDKLDATIVAQGGRPGTSEESSYRRIIERARTLMADPPVLLKGYGQHVGTADMLRRTIERAHRINDDREGFTVRIDVFRYLLHAARIVAKDML